MEDLARALKAEVFYDALTGYGYFRRFGSAAVFAIGAPWILWDWKEPVSVTAPAEEPGGPAFSADFRTALEKRYGALEKQNANSYSVAAILIDPGHGGKDTGAIGEHGEPNGSLRIVEKELNLRIALEIYSELKRRFPERRIILSRDRDIYPSLEERVDLANSETLEANQAIIYVSIHANASFNKNARGFEVWYLNPEYRRNVVDATLSKKIGEDIAPIMNAMLEEEYTTESIILARSILGRLERSIGKDSPSRGIRAEEWFVVRNAHMPSVLVETGFVTSPEEAILLSDESYLRRLSESIYNGIVDFVQYFESQKGPSER
jgi:N-acetylmuramoyl-L-alanine amidase